MTIFFLQMTMMAFRTCFTELYWIRTFYELFDTELVVSGIRKPNFPTLRYVPTTNIWKKKIENVAGGKSQTSIA